MPKVREAEAGRNVMSWRYELYFAACALAAGTLGMALLFAAIRFLPPAWLTVAMTAATAHVVMGFAFWGARKVADPWLKRMSHKEFERRVMRVMAADAKREADAWRDASMRIDTAMRKAEARQASEQKPEGTR